MNFIKTCFNSFFRTLGRILCYVAIGMILSFLFTKLDVHADTDFYVKLNSVTLNYKDYIYIPEGNRVFEFDDGSLYAPDQVPQNFIATFCSSDDKITNWYSNINDNSLPHELNIYKTNIPCQYSTSDYSGGTITYFYGKSFTCPAGGNTSTCSSWGKWTFYSYSGSYQLLSFMTTNDDISIDFSSGAVISQNQQIINQNQQIINGQNNIINNQNENTDKTIDNQNKNTDKTIDSQKACFEIGKSSGKIDNKYLDSLGDEFSSNGFAITDYYSITDSTLQTINPRPNTASFSWFYDINKNKISSFNNGLSGNINIPSNAYYVRFSINKFTDQPTFKICQNGNQAINSNLEQAENTRKGIWETIKGIPESVANAIKGLFIPDNFDFLNDFKDTLSNKLGFIAEVPIKLIDFIISLADFTWTEFSSITFPKIEIMGVSFWNDITIDVGPILGGLKKYRYITDVLCVTLCVNTLRKMYDKFTGGSGE